MNTPEALTTENVTAIVQEAIALLFIGEKYASLVDSWDKASEIALRQSFQHTNINPLTGDPWPVLFPSAKSIKEFTDTVNFSSPEPEKQITQMLEEVDKQLYQPKPKRRYDPLKRILSE